MKMAYFVWALVNDQHTVVVDLGFTEDVGTRRGREFLRCPSLGLRELGIDCAGVSHVIVSHMHYDHVGNYDLFPNATFYLQEDEMRFYTGKYVRHAAFRHSIEVDDVLAMVRYNYEGRLMLVDGEREVVPGVHVHRVGGHTAGLQIVTAQTAQGRAVLATDASHYYHNFEKNVPFMVLHDLPGMYDSFDRMRGIGRQIGPHRSRARSPGSGALAAGCRRYRVAGVDAGGSHVGTEAGERHAYHRDWSQWTDR